MDEKKDAMLDEMADETPEKVQEAEATLEAAGSEIAEEAADIAGAEDAVDAAVEEAAGVADAEEAADVTESEGAETAEDALTAAQGEGTESEAQEDPAQSAKDEAPAAKEPAKKATSGGKIGDLVIVGIIAIILGILLALPSFLGVTNGGGSKEAASSGGVAATVNGTVISEDEVTKYVTDFRDKQGLQSDADWGKWMVGFGYTPEGLRSDTIEYFVNRELLRQAIAEQNVQVEESAIDDYIAMITEQVGGESAFNEALEMEGLTLETYREEVKFSLEQQELAKKVAPVEEKVDDAEVLELVKMYFPDSVDKDAKSLDGVDQEIVEQMRSMLTSSAMQQSFDAWMNEYRSKANIEITSMPASLPYIIDLAPYEKAAAEADEGVDEGEGEVVVEEASASSAGASASSAAASSDSSAAASSSASSASSASASAASE